MFKRKKMLSLGLAVLVAASVVMPGIQSSRVYAEEVDAPIAAEAVSPFITRSGDKLMDGDREFRFISANVPTLSMVEDIYWRTPTEWEQEDAFKTLVQMGGTVTRPYVLSVRKADDPADMVRHIMGVGSDDKLIFNEDAFVAYDKMIQLAGEYGIHLILPFVDQYQWQGGIAEYAAFRGKSKDAFWTDPQLIADFKSVISYTLNRVNTFTGVAYKDDPTILAWETGNELVPQSSAWTHDMATYIKSIDANHLVLDGKYGIDDASLTDDAIDIVSNHYYPDHYPSYASQVNVDKNKAAGKKPFIVGEFGFKSTNELSAFLDNAIENGTSGAMIWSLRYHSRDGGFYPHTESTFNGVFYGAYRWPGFPSGDGFDETNMLNTLRDKAFEIRGFSEAPALPKPEAPVMLSVDSVSTISWLGSVGASSYRVERSGQPDGGWTVVGENVYDAVPTESQLFDDTSAVSGQTYYYRVTAKNGAGESARSAVVGPVAAKHVIQDEMRNFGKLYSHTSDLEYESRDPNAFGGDVSRIKALATDNQQSVQYAIPLHEDGTPVKVKSVTVEGYVASASSDQNFSLSASSDGSAFEPVDAEAAESGGSWKKRSYTTGELADGVKVLRIDYPAASASGQLGKVVIEYEHDGTALTFPNSVQQGGITNGILSDDLNNFLKMDSHSANLGFSSDTPEYFGGDAKRLSRTSNEHEWFTYKADGDMNYFKFYEYARQNPADYVLPDFKFYTSANGTDFTEFTNVVKTSKLGEGYWAKTDYIAYQLPAGTRYVKFEFPVVPESHQDQRWNPQVSSLQIGVGGAKLDPPAEIKKSAIIDDFEGYTGSNNALCAAYKANADGSPVTLSLDTAGKVNGAYAMKLVTDLSKGWGGMEKDLAGADWSGNSGIQLWVNPGGKEVGLTLQLTEGMGTQNEVWKSDTRISGNEPVLVQLPFRNFYIPDWWKSSHAGQGNGKVDLSGAASFGLYFDGPAGDTTLMIDDIKLYRLPTIDTFEGYDGDNAKLAAGYSVNPDGGPITLSLDTGHKSEGGLGLKLAYDLTGKGFGGVTKQLGGIDWTGNNGIQLWLEPDGRNRGVTVQVKESSGEYWEVKIPTSGTAAQTVSVPFHLFAMPSWSGKDNGKLDIGSIAEFSVYVDRGAGEAGTGAIYLDDIKAAKLKDIDSFDYYQGSSSLVGAAYARNTSGDMITASLDSAWKKSGSYALKLDYTLTDAVGYAGVNKALGAMNWSEGGNAVQFWMLPNGANHGLTFQFKETDGDIWEAQVSMAGTEEQLVTIPLAGLTRTKWSTGDGIMDVSSVAEYSIYVNKGSGSAGSYSVSLDDVGLTTIPVIDNFDYYDGRELVALGAYTRNPWGGSLTITPDAGHKESGRFGMKYEYSYPDAATNFAGATKLLGLSDWSGEDGIRFWYTPDGSGRKLVVQFKESDGETWEYYVTLTGTEAKVLKMPFDQFVHAPWNTAGNGTLDLNAITEFSLYVNQGDGTVGSGTLYFDSIGLYQGNTDPTDPTGPTDPGPSGPSNPGTPQDKTVWKVTADQLKPTGQGTVVLNAPAGVTMLKLPLQAGALLGKNNLQVKIGDAALTVGAGALQAASQLLTASGQGTGASLYISLTSSAGSAPASSAATEKWKASGTVYDIQVGVWTAAGIKQPLTKWAYPVQLQLPVSKELNPKLAGIYAGSSDGGWIYAGGRTDKEGTVIRAFITQPGSYAVLTREKFFADVPDGSWASDSIRQLAALQIINGTDAEHFTPNRSITRGEFAVILAKVLELPAADNLPFTDVNAEAFYADAVAAAAQAGLIHGRDADTFAPNDKISREEMAALIVRAFELKMGTVGVTDRHQYNDINAISGWTLEAVDKAFASGLMNGTESGNFAPDKEVTRAEAAVGLARLLDRLLQ
ncbi:S-layer homology domain-containing protein [Paenibacillus glycanilyticus]|uniref:S-layer homology domain-containing protein n=1 Tax=Paenibacillus glycanilyticus TaxID=126569 RepID=UPI000FD7D65F|nr:carbohydrate binding domain-containing protein [Paenibacillus glycanilyticus]